MKTINRLVAGLFVLLVAACDTYTQDEYIPEYVVESYLIAGEALPVVKISETAAINVAYRFESYAVDNATVQVVLEDENGGTEERFVYQSSSPGIYSAVDQQVEVLPLRRYALEVEIPGHSQMITATTLVPGDFRIEALAVDSLVYQAEEALLLHVSRSSYPGRQAYYMNKLHALDTTNALTPFFQDLYDDEEVSKQDLIDNSSGITNEANFEVLANDMLGVIVPWIGVAFYGPNEIVMDAIDDNLYDFIRSQEENGSRPLGERDNIIDYIEGGRGVFGSLARAKVEVFVVP